MCSIETYNPCLDSEYIPRGRNFLSLIHAQPLASKSFSGLSKGYVVGRLEALTASIAGRDQKVGVSIRDPA